jgi:hypothetical protein
MLFLICCCGWLASGVLGYCGVRRVSTQSDLPWLNKDKVLWSIMGVLLGPVLLLAGLFLLFGDLVVRAAPEWFNRPSRW